MVFAVHGRGAEHEAHERAVEYLLDLRARPVVAGFWQSGRRRPLCDMGRQAARGESGRGRERGGTCEAKHGVGVRVGWVHRVRC